MIKLIDILKEIKINKPFRWVNFKAQINDKDEIEDDIIYYIDLSNEKDVNNTWYGTISNNTVKIFFENEMDKNSMEALINLLKKGDKKYNIHLLNHLNTYVIFDKSLVDIVDSLDEIKVNNPNEIIIGYKDDEGIWIDEDLMLKYLLPLFPNERKNIEDWVEELNDFGADEEDLVTNIKQLKQAYIYSGNRENVLDEIKIK